MIDGSEKRNRQLAFELQNSYVCEKRSNIVSLISCTACTFWITSTVITDATCKAAIQTVILLLPWLCKI